MSWHDFVNHNNLIGVNNMWANFYSVSHAFILQYRILCRMKGAENDWRKEKKDKEIKQQIDPGK